MRALLRRFDNPLPPKSLKQSLRQKFRLAPSLGGQRIYAVIRVSVPYDQNFRAFFSCVESAVLFTVQRKTGRVNRLCTAIPVDAQVAIDADGGNDIYFVCNEPRFFEAKKPQTMLLAALWRARRDLNPRPLA